MVRQHPAAKGAPPATAIHARALGACDPAERFEVVLTLRRADEAGFRSLVSRLEAGEPGARPVSRDEYEQRHGAAAQDVQQVLGFARAHGLRVLRQDPASRRVVLSGTVAQFNTAFGVQLQRFAVMWLCTTVTSTWAMGAIDDALGLRWAWLAKPAVELALGIVGFVLSRHWIYRR